MRKVVYVLSDGTKWRVKCDHCADELKDTQSQAIATAKQHVASLPQGTLSQILIQGQGGQWRTEWTYGQDPFPPPG
jgi:hypothetical protein